MYFIPCSKRELVVKIVFMGTTSFGIPGLDALGAAGHEIAGIVSTPAREKGRGQIVVESDITLHSRKQGYKPVFCPENLRSEELISDLKSLDADIFIVVAFRILPPEIFSIPKMGTYNVHASLLPKYRGPAPIQRALAAGETETGITVFRIDKGVDTGTIVLQKRTAIADNDTSLTLSAKLSLLGAAGLREALTMIEAGSVTFSGQDDSRASPAPKLVKSEGRIEWTLPAKTVYNRIRAFVSFPGSFAFAGDVRFLVERAEPAGVPDTHLAAGTVLSVTAAGLDVQCNPGVIRITTVKPDGKKSMAARDFAIGRNILKGTKLA
jgi:methionyl-tRNA formyltransferase